MRDIGDEHAFDELNVSYLTHRAWARPGECRRTSGIAARASTSASESGRSRPCRRSRGGTGRTGCRCDEMSRYLRHARPASAHREVFLRVRKPGGPLLSASVGDAFRVLGQPQRAEHSIRGSALSAPLSGPCICCAREPRSRPSVICSAIAVWRAPAYTCGCTWTIFEPPRSTCRHRRRRNDERVLHVPLSSRPVDHGLSPTQTGSRS